MDSTNYSTIDWDIVRNHVKKHGYWVNDAEKLAPNQFFASFYEEDNVLINHANQS